MALKKKSDKKLIEKQEILALELEGHVRSHREMKKLEQNSSRVKLNDIAEEVLRLEVIDQHPGLNNIASHDQQLILPEFTAHGVARVQTHALLPTADEIRVSEEGTEEDNNNNAFNLDQ